MNSKEIREKFLDYFRKQGHAVVPSSSLVPDDPSVLLTTAGMQQFKKYYTGEADPLKTIHPNLGKPLGEKSAASIQKSFRTSDIDEVGDVTHLTFFEMMGNFSFGGYFKKEAITFAYEFITKELSLPISYVTIFTGSEAVPKDEESKKIWNGLGVSDVREEGMEDVFWGPTGNEGPCGPTTEIYCKNADGQDVEIWNIVFNQFFYPGSREELLAGAPDKELKPLETPGVDTGMGFERLVMIAQNKKNIFETDLYQSIMDLLPTEMEERVKRVMADHLRAMTFLIVDGVRPSNKEAGYVLRRLMRRVIVHGKRANLTEGDMEQLIGAIVMHYGYFYPGMEAALVAEVFEAEYEKFERTLDKGLREMNKLEKIDAVTAFNLFQSFGLPYEIIKELGEAKSSELSRQGFEEEFAKHQHISRAGQVKKFGGHGLLLDTGELKAKDEEELKIVTRLHTSTHMLQQALREVLGKEVTQAGSDITVKRTRFDFTFSRKLTDEEKKKVEDLINEKIKEDLPMQKVVLPRAEAEKTGALYFFKEKYPDPVNVYFIGKDIESAWSKEFCGGPHVTHTGEIGHFKITKEEAVAVGTRRIRGVVE